MLMIGFQFFFCSTLIGLAGVRLIRYGDAIASRTGMTRSWIGMILVASVTSLPELVTGLSAVTVVQAPDMAVGDVLGSCIFNRQSWLPWTLASEKPRSTRWLITAI